LCIWGDAGVHRVLLGLVYITVKAHPSAPLHWCQVTKPQPRRVRSQDSEREALRLYPGGVC
jgi:hypothetical protein